MSRIDDLVNNYERFVSLRWRTGLAPAQRVWMALYSPDEERRLRLHIAEFETATKKSGYDWLLIDIDDEFALWMAAHKYREQYFDNPMLLRPALAGFFKQLVIKVGAQIQESAGDNTVVGLLGAGSLYGLGDRVKVSAFVDQVQDLVTGRLLVFFPGEVEGNNFRLMGARDGWNYHAVVLTAEKGWLK